MGGDERMSATLLDRLTHKATILEFVGTSYRFRSMLFLPAENCHKDESDVSLLIRNIVERTSFFERICYVQPIH